MSDRALLELANMSAALKDALREAYGLAQAGEYGEPLREVLTFARDLVAIANETLATDPQSGEHARGIALHMAEQLAELAWAPGVANRRDHQGGLEWKSPETSETSSSQSLCSGSPMY